MYFNSSSINDFMAKQGFKGFFQISSTWIFSAFFLLIVINLIFLNIKVLGQKAVVEDSKTSNKQFVDDGSKTSLVTQESISNLKNPSATTSAVSLTECSDSCIAQLDKRIDRKINQLKSELNKQIAAAIPSSSVIPLQTGTSTSSNTTAIKELIVSFGGNGSTTSTSWTDMTTTDINFNPANYPGATGFYFQANLRADAPDKTTYARIYDATHFVGVIGSDISSLGMSSNLVESGKLTFLSGPLRLRVQIHSLNGNAAFLDSARIRITF